MLEGLLNLRPYYLGGGYVVNKNITALNMEHVDVSNLSLLSSYAGG